MAISRMQQPRQNYGLGSFVKKITGKITKPITKFAQKIVPKEIAGIMRAAAPFLPPGYREAAYLLGTAKQTGRISPMDLALTALPYANKALGSQKSLPLMERKGFFAERLPKANKFLFGSPEQILGGTPRNQVTQDATTGIFGSGGKMFQFGGEQGVMDQIKGFRDQTKLGDFLLGGKEPGTFGMSKIAGIGTGLLSLIQSAKTPEEAGNNLASATGNSADYDEGYEMFSMLNTDAFRIPDQFVLKQNVASGGLMRTNYAMGAGEKGVVNPFIPKPQGPALPDEDKPFRPKPLKPIKMAEFDLLEYQEEFERVFPDMKELRGTDEYNEMLEDYFRGLASKDKEGIMMAEIPRDLDLEKAKEMFIEFNGREPVDMQELLQFFNVKQQAAEGGLMRENFALGSMPTAQESGLGGLPIEADMRYTGGFMPYGAVEKADDVPARLSKNEFVFTADAVRAAGGGSVQKGAKKMYDAMKQLEQQPEAKGAMA
jgi:hypothetical protein